MPAASVPVISICQVQAVEPGSCRRHRQRIRTLRSRTSKLRRCGQVSRSGGQALGMATLKEGGTRRSRRAVRAGRRSTRRRLPRPNTPSATAPRRTRRRQRRAEGCGSMHHVEGDCQRLAAEGGARGAVAVAGCGGGVSVRWTSTQTSASRLKAADEAERRAPRTSTPKPAPAPASKPAAAPSPVRRSPMPNNVVRSWTSQCADVVLAHTPRPRSCAAGSAQ